MQTSTSISPVDPAPPQRTLARPATTTSFADLVTRSDPREPPLPAPSRRDDRPAQRRDDGAADSGELPARARPERSDAGKRDPAQSAAGKPGDKDDDRDDRRQSVDATGAGSPTLAAQGAVATTGQAPQPPSDPAAASAKDGGPIVAAASGVVGKAGAAATPTTEAPGTPSKVGGTVPALLGDASIVAGVPSGKGDAKQAAATDKANDGAASGAAATKDGKAAAASLLAAPATAGKTAAPLQPGAAQDTDRKAITAGTAPAAGGADAKPAADAAKGDAAPAPAPPEGKAEGPQSAPAQKADATPPQSPQPQPASDATRLAVQLAPAAPAAQASLAQATLLQVPQIAVTIAAHAKAGESRFQIRLDPPELGRIDVSLSVDKAGATTTTLTVERMDTLDLLQRDSRSLERALTSAGFKADQGSLQFNLRDSAGGQNPGGTHAGPSGQGHDQGHRPHRASARRFVFTDTEAAQAAPPLPQTIAAYAAGLCRLGGLDIKV